MTSTVVPSKLNEVREVRGSFTNNCQLLVLCSYYLCYHSKSIEMRCTSGMYWNGETRMCDYAQNVNCPTDSNVDANPLPKCTTAGHYSMPHPARCEYFIMCIDGDQTVQQCDAFYRWDVIAQSCVMKDRATCILDLSSAERRQFWTRQDFLPSHGQ